MKARPGEMAALAVIQKVLQGGYMNLALEETMQEMGLQGGARSAAACGAAVFFFQKLIETTLLLAFF